MASVGLKTQLSGLARKLVNDNLLSEADAEEASSEAAKQKISIVSYLVENNKIAANELAMIASQEFGVPVFDLSSMELDPEVTKLVSEKLIRTHHALPLFKRGNRLHIAVSDPTNLNALDEIKFHVGMTTEAILVLDDKLGKNIDKAMAANDTSLADMAGDSSLDDVEFADGLHPDHPLLLRRLVP